MDIGWIINIYKSNQEKKAKEKKQERSKEKAAEKAAAKEGKVGINGTGNVI